MKNITNKLGQIGSQYIKHTNSIKQDIANMDDLNILLKYLPLLKLDNNYLLDDARPRKRTNSHLSLAVRHRSTKRPDDESWRKYILENLAKHLEYIDNETKKTEENDSTIETPYSIYHNWYDYISIPCTEEAIWQAYLLKKTSNLIGMRWHANYSRRSFINSYNDLDEVVKESLHVFLPISQKEINAYKTENILPSVHIEKTGIYIRHHWFDPWNGLKEVKCSVEYNHNNNKIIDFSSEEIVLIKYWCGIMF
ncbi:MAG: hypothetical protein ACLUN1_08870 [Odoribacter splanchnicus]|jgi:hypothetical protein|nr:hypothetical protein [Odoribacter splanchnicus]MDB9230387.1 hypothetical protein [Odoribacter splanchnicus]NUN84416.1 hypothetical protein [Odoribacter splanchnicus]HCL19205.1 hypothetical protein [Odoribacter splanchnicus]HCU27809.1 hypothetical protein [Odoribacter splanchnicus]